MQLADVQDSELLWDVYKKDAKSELSSMRSHSCKSPSEDCGRPHKLSGNHSGMTEAVQSFMCSHIVSMLTTRYQNHVSLRGLETACLDSEVKKKSHANHVRSANSLTNPLTHSLTTFLTSASPCLRCWNARCTAVRVVLGWLTLCL